MDGSRGCGESTGPVEGDDHSACVSTEWGHTISRLAWKRMSDPSYENGGADNYNILLSAKTSVGFFILPMAGFFSKGISEL